MSTQILRPRGYTKTEKVIHDMLLENTGMAMMDSGGDSGRNWQHNQTIVDFRKIPELHLTFEVFNFYFSYQNINNLIRMFRGGCLFRLFCSRHRLV